MADGIANIELRLFRLKPVCGRLHGGCTGSSEGEGEDEDSPSAIRGAARDSGVELRAADIILVVAIEPAASGEPGRQAIRGEDKYSRFSASFPV